MPFAITQWSGKAFETEQKVTGTSQEVAGPWEKDRKRPIEANLREHPGNTLLIALGASFLAGTILRNMRKAIAVPSAPPEDSASSLPSGGARPRPLRFWKRS